MPAVISPWLQEYREPDPNYEQGDARQARGRMVQSVRLPKLVRSDERHWSPVQQAQDEAYFPQQNAGTQSEIGAGKHK